MNSQSPVLDAESALPYLGKTVLVELAWEQDPESLWCCMHIVGIVLPLAGIQEEPYFLVKHVAGDEPFPNEMFWSNVRTIRVMRYRDRHGSGNVLGRVTHPDDSRSRAALPSPRRQERDDKGSALGVWWWHQPSMELMARRTSFWRRVPIRCYSFQCV